jgi:tRNA nucleotidyltransferase (CCA-adding enzyme)
VHALRLDHVRMSGWTHFSHDADMGVRAEGGTQEEVFEQMALGMTALITDPAGVAAVEDVEIACEAPSTDLLLVDWLNALVYEMAVRRMLFGRFAVTLDGTRLRGVASGERVDVRRHQPVVEVKGATYTALKFHRRDDGCWEAQCILDV